MRVQLGALEAAPDLGIPTASMRLGSRAMNVGSL